MALRLEVAEFQDETRWRWRLLDEAGALLADHDVRLDRGASEYEGFADPYRFLHWHVDPERGAESTEMLAARLGRWIGRHVWGVVGERIAEFARHAPVAVRVLVSDEAEALLLRPLELGYVGGRALALHDVSLVFESTAAPAPREKAPVRERLRMLALFSVPADQAALNLRYERYELRRLVQRVALTAEAAIELRILQYGVTRTLLSEVLAEAEGWDLIHFSGHGLPEGLLLERADGRADVVPSEQLAELLWPARERLKLVTLSSCESAAAAAARTLQRLGLPLPDGVEGCEPDDGRLPSIAHHLVQRLGCAVVAMRYPVDDRFAIVLCGRLYEALLRDRQPLTRSLQMAIHEVHAAVAHAGHGALQSATPALFGPRAVALSLVPPPGEPSGFDISTPGLAYFEPEPKRFVGRVGALARASAALKPESERRAVLFHGMAGGGKTACALELSYRHERGRFQAMVWYRAPVDGHDISGALAAFAVALERQLDGLEIAHVIDDRERLLAFLPRWVRLLEDRAILIVVDNVESLLTDAGTWRDERWGLLVGASVRHDGLSRLVLTSRQVPADLAANRRTLVERIDTLTPSESALLARQLPELGALLRAHEERGDAEAGELVRGVLATMQGNPELIRLADACACDRTMLRERLTDAAAAWGERSRALQAFFSGRDGAMEAETFLPVLEAWTHSTLRRLPSSAQTAFFAVCALEPGDREMPVLAPCWITLRKALDGDTAPADLGEALGTAIAHGLIEHDAEAGLHARMLLVHPAVEAAGRQGAPDGLQAIVDETLGRFWAATFAHATTHAADEQLGWLTVRAGLAAAPYLLRTGQYALASMLLERVLKWDESPRVVAAVLPLMERLAEAQVGMQTELASRAAWLAARSNQHPRETIAPLQELLAEVQARGDYQLAGSIAGDIVNLLWKTSQLEEALAFNEVEADYTRRAGLGPWTQLADEGKRLQILTALGRYEEVLAEAGRLRVRMEQLGERGKNEVVEIWNVRESILDVAHSAALDLERDEDALALNAEIIASKRKRGGSALELAAAATNDASSLIRLRRFEEAERLLRSVRDVFEREQARELLARLFGVWADLKGATGHLEEATRFARRSLRMGYAINDADLAAAVHTNQGTRLAVNDSRGASAHLLAAGLIGYQSREGHFSLVDAKLAVLVGRVGDDVLPPSFAVLCAWLKEEAEIDLARLFASLPTTAGSAEEAFAAVVASARRDAGRISP